MTSLPGPAKTNAALRVGDVDEVVAVGEVLLTRAREQCLRRRGCCRSEVVAVVGEVVVAAEQRIVAGTADDVVARPADDAVVAAVAAERVGAVAAVDGVVARRRRVVRVVAIDLVVANAGEDQVVAPPPKMRSLAKSSATDSPSRSSKLGDLLSPQILSLPSPP
jgi:hypothetical protein